MVAVLPVELLVSLQQQVACRQDQLRQLSIFYNASLPSPNILVCNGLEDTGKIESILAVLESQNIEHILVKSKECLSQRHLLAKIFAACLRKCRTENAADQYDRVDSFNALLENLRKLLSGRSNRLVLVLDSVDEQRNASATLLPALARLGEVIPCLSVILTCNSPRPLILHKSGVFHVHFPPYSRKDAIQVLTKSPPPLLPDALPDYAPDIDRDRLLQIYRQFVTTVYETLISSTSTSVKTFQKTCEKLWPRFIWPLVSGEHPPGQHGRSGTVIWDFARLLSRGRNLFQADGEKALREHLRPDNVIAVTFDELIRQKEKQKLATTSILDPTKQSITAEFDKKQSNNRSHPPLLRHFTTLVLLASYLASHNLQKHDIVLFSRLSSSSTSKRKYLTKSRSGGISKTPTKSRSRNGDNDDNETLETPSKKSKAKEIAAAEATTPKKERADRSMRAIFDRTSNIARPFTMERLIAILRAIHPDGIPQRRGTADRVYMEMAELERLRLIVRAAGADAFSGSTGSRGTSGGDMSTDEIMEEKWRVNVGKDWVQNMGKVWGVGLEGWEIE